MMMNVVPIWVNMSMSTVFTTALLRTLFCICSQVGELWGNGLKTIFIPGWFGMFKHAFEDFDLAMVLKDHGGATGQAVVGLFSLWDELQSCDDIIDVCRVIFGIFKTEEDKAKAAELEQKRMARAMLLMTDWKAQIEEKEAEAAGKNNEGIEGGEKGEGGRKVKRYERPSKQLPMSLNEKKKLFFGDINIFQGILGDDETKDVL